MTKLWVDDERPKPDETWVRMLHSDAAIAQLYVWRQYGIVPEEVSLDHDLGEVDGHDDTTMRVVDWMAANNFWPKEITIHTANPVGRENLLRAINADAPPEVEISIRYW